VRFFDERMLFVLRWVSERYIAPLSVVIGRSHPPRVAGEEAAARRRGAWGSAAASLTRAAEGHPRVTSRRGTEPLLERYGGSGILEAGTRTWLRPLPEDEAAVAVEAIAACLASGRRALVLVPEAEPLPNTAREVLDAFGSRAVTFSGGDDRTRYRAWLEIRSRVYDVVVGTRPAVFAPLEHLGLIWISREVHPGHREDRSPYYHVREVATARARIEGAACVVSSLSPSVETAVACAERKWRTARPARDVERAAAPLVETTAPEAEDRSPRLGRLLKTARRAVLLLTRRGYGVARVCRSCGEPAACATCGGPIVVERGAARCGACGAPGRCRHCGGGLFGIERGGTERIAEWAGRFTVHDLTVGTAAVVKDLGPNRLDLVAILDPDRALARPGIHAGEQALATWMEAAVWAGPKSGGGRVLVQTRRPGHPAVQALVRWEPVPFLLSEAARREEAGFPAGHAVFRVAGGAALEALLRAAGAETVLATVGDELTVCLAAVHPGRGAEFRREVLRLAGEGTVDRVEAEPQLA